MSYYPERRHPRFTFTDFPLVFSLQLGEPSWPDRPLRLEPKNISQGGMKFLCNRRIPIFTELKVTLLHREQGKPVAELVGKVVRLEEIDTGIGERTYGIAMEFLAGQASLQTLLSAPPSS